MRPQIPARQAGPAEIGSCTSKLPKSSRPPFRRSGPQLRSPSKAPASTRNEVSRCLSLAPATTLQQFPCMRSAHRWHRRRMRLRWSCSNAIRFSPVANLNRRRLMNGRKVSESMASCSHCWSVHARTANLAINWSRANGAGGRRNRSEWKPFRAA